MLNNNMVKGVFYEASITEWDGTVSNVIARKIDNGEVEIYYNNGATEQQYVDEDGQMQSKPINVWVQHVISEEYFFMETKARLHGTCTFKAIECPVSGYIN